MERMHDMGDMAPVGAGHWVLVAAGLAALASAGSVLAALRPGAGVAPRVAHLTMAATMMVQIGWMSRPAQLLSLAGLGLAATAVSWHVVRAGAGHGCLADVLGMAAVLATPLIAGDDTAVVLAVATGWAITSSVIRAARPESNNRCEGLGALVAAGAMAAMAIAMSST